MRPSYLATLNLGLLGGAGTSARSRRQGGRTKPSPPPSAIHVFRGGPGRETSRDMSPGAPLELGTRRQAGGTGGLGRKGRACLAGHFLRILLSAAALGTALGAPLQWEVYRPPVLVSVHWASTAAMPGRKVGCQSGAVAPGGDVGGGSGPPLQHSTPRDVSLCTPPRGCCSSLPHDQENTSDLRPSGS